MERHCKAEWLRVHKDFARNNGKATRCEVFCTLSQDLMVSSLGSLEKLRLQPDHELVRCRAALPQLHALSPRRCNVQGILHTMFE